MLFGTRHPTTCGSLQRLREKGTFMKAIIVSAMVLVSASSAFATSPEILKSCSAKIRFPNEKDRIKENTLKFMFLKSGDKTIARITNAAGTKDDEASITEHSIREGLGKLKLDDDGIDGMDLNLGEQLISHAFSVTSNKLLKTFMSVDFDLTKVRSVKVFLAGNPTHMGASAIIDAKDANGKLLGTFLGGFMVAPCK